jgi:hypothetical protein
MSLRVLIYSDGDVFGSAVGDDGVTRKRLRLTECELWMTVSISIDGDSTRRLLICRIIEASDIRLFS